MTGVDNREDAQASGDFESTRTARLEREGAARRLLADALNTLRDFAAATTDSCTVSKLIAATDATVQQHFIDKILDGHRFRGLRCLGAERVLFAFTCASDRLCLIEPSFLVVVDMRRRRVVQLIDPFDPDEPVEVPQRAMGMSTAIAAGAGAFSATDVKQVTVKITKVQHRAARIDGISVAFVGESGSLLLPPGSHELEWFAADKPGAGFDVSLAGANEPFSISRTIGPQGFEAGFFPFTVS